MICTGVGNIICFLPQSFHFCKKEKLKMIDQFLRDIYYPANEGVIQRIKEIRTKYLAKNKKEKK